MRSSAGVELALQGDAWLEQGQVPAVREEQVGGGGKDRHGWGTFEPWSARGKSASLACRASEHRYLVVNSQPWRTADARAARTSISVSAEGAPTSRKKFSIPAGEKMTTL